MVAQCKIKPGVSRHSTKCVIL